MRSEAVAAKIAMLQWSLPAGMAAYRPTRIQGANRMVSWRKAGGMPLVGALIGRIPASAENLPVAVDVLTHSVNVWNPRSPLRFYCLQYQYCMRSTIKASPCLPPPSHSLSHYRSRCDQLQVSLLQVPEQSVLIVRALHWLALCVTLLEYGF